MTIATNMVAGKEGRVALGVVTTGGDVLNPIDLDDWNVSDTVEIIKTKSFERRGRTGGNPGFLDTTVGFKGYFSSLNGDNPYADHGLKDGETVYNLFLYISGVDDEDAFAGLYYFFPSILCLSCKTVIKADGRVDIDFSGVPQEDFYQPGDLLEQGVDGGTFDNE